MFLRYLALVLEWVFFIGMAGSLVVSLLAFVGDIHVFFDKDEEASSHASDHSYAPSSAGADD